MSDLLLAYYGDDFTGSTDVMESLAYAGIPTVLFVAPPTKAQLAEYPGLRAFGIAGTSRTMSPEAMEADLPGLFSALATSGAPLIHYKMCSTFDSSPRLGSIGKAIDIGKRVVGGPFVPLVVGAPILGRYCAFGNLFARSGLDTAPYRLDRHPTMSCHPMTPMTEADLRLLLAEQTRQSVALLDAATLEAETNQIDEAFSGLLEKRPDVVLFDTMTDEHLRQIGRLIWTHRPDSETMFIVGSSGVEYALTAHWRETNECDLAEPPPGGEPVDQIAVVSGSCSPVTDRQIAWAIEQGFQEIPLDTQRLVSPETSPAATKQAVTWALDALSHGKSVILPTSRGPEDNRLAKTKQRCQELAIENTAKVLGQAQGVILRQIIEQRIKQQRPLKRVAVTGGDTSGYVARELGITSLEMIGRLAPGSPLCRARCQAKTNHPTAIDGCEITFKGGQVGKTDFWGTVLRGRP